MRLSPGVQTCLPYEEPNLPLEKKMWVVVNQWVSLFTALSINPFVCLSICLAVCLVWLSVCHCVWCAMRVFGLNDLGRSSSTVVSSWVPRVGFTIITVQSKPNSARNCACACVCVCVCVCMYVWQKLNTYNVHVKYSTAIFVVKNVQLKA